MSENAYDSKPALPNKMLNENGSITDLFGNAVVPTSDAYKNRPSLPNKWLNADGTYSTLSELIAGGIDTDIFVIVNELPAEGDTKKIYLVPDGDGGFDEYHWTGTAWDPIGTIDFDPTQYYTKTQTDSNFLKKDNTSVYTPSGDYNPSTKKYVDDAIASLGSAEQIIYWNGDTTDYTFWNNLKEIETPVIVYATYSSKSYHVFISNPKTDIVPTSGHICSIQLIPVVPTYLNRDDYSEFRPLGYLSVSLTFDNDDALVVGISASAVAGTRLYYLDTSHNYSTPYSPQYPGSPATKKYVDDNMPIGTELDIDKNATIPSGWQEIEYDTGWVTVPLDTAKCSVHIGSGANANTNYTPKIRRIGNVVYLRGRINIQKSNITTGTANPLVTSTFDSKFLTDDCEINIVTVLNTSGKSVYNVYIGSQVRTDTNASKMCFYGTASTWSSVPDDIAIQLDTSWAVDDLTTKRIKRIS